jgi:hypothetical protein
MLVPFLIWRTRGPETSLGWLPKHLPSYKTDVLSFVLWLKVKIVVLL